MAKHLRSLSACAFSLLRIAWLYPLLISLLVSAFGDTRSMKFLSVLCTCSATDGLVGGEHHVGEWPISVLPQGEPGGPKDSAHEQSSAHPISRDTCCSENLIVVDINMSESYHRSTQEVGKKLPLSVSVGLVNRLWSPGRAPHRGTDMAPAMRGSGF